MTEKQNVKRVELRLLQVKGAKRVSRDQRMKRRLITSIRNQKAEVELRTMAKYFVEPVISRKVLKYQTTQL